LPEVFAGFEEGESITVLDLGPGSASTLTYLSRFRAKVIFADLIDNPELRNPPEDADMATLADLISDQLSVPPGLHIDVCLMWDYLHYLDVHVIEALSSVLQPLIRPTTRGYGFGALHSRDPMQGNRYGISGPEELTSTPLTDEEPYTPHSQQWLGEHMLALRISRGTLLMEGRLELLFEAP
jgi:hypothetical protein